MKTPLHDGEAAVKEGPANLQRGAETVGGRLYLTSHRLIFESHRLNVQTGSTTVDLTEVASVEKCWTRFLNLVPLFPNSISVKTNDGAEFRIVVQGREGWISAMDQSQEPRGSV